ncbi:MAG: EAL domain-containing protein [Campylobacterota bacterium]
MVKLGYGVLIICIVLVVTSTVYVDKTTEKTVSERNQVYHLLENMKKNYYLLQIHYLQAKKQEINVLHELTPMLAQMQQNLDRLKELHNDTADIKSLAQVNDQLRFKVQRSQVDGEIKNVFNEDFLIIIDSIAKSYDEQLLHHRQNVFSYQRFISGMFVLLSAVFVYFVYFHNKEKRKLARLKRNLEKTLVTDALTGLNNRVAIIKEFRKKHDDLAVVMFNIAKFKHINDFYGTNVGDYVLKSFALELKKLTKKCSGAKVYRVGGDDFIVTVNSTKTQDVRQMAHMVISRFQKSGIVYKDTLIDIALVASITKQKPYLETGDLALKEAKRDKNSSIVVYSDTLDKSHIVAKNINAVKMLKEGIAHDRFFPQFQPIVDLKTGKVIKYEALIRLRLDDGSIVYPNSFIEEAKDSKLLNKLTKIMLIKSFEKFKKIDCSFSVNLSFSEIIDQQNQDEIVKILDDYGRHAKKLTFEILEDDAIDDYGLLQRFLNRVEKFGVDIAIDDFGSGYSNFGHIISMNTHFLKLDSSLIKIVDYDVQARVLVKSIVSFAKDMQIKTVAEFVHSQDVLDMVKRLGVDYAQGFYLGKPSERLQNLECGYEI